MSIKIKLTIVLDGDVDADLVQFINGLARNERDSDIKDILRDHIARIGGRNRSDIILESIKDLAGKLEGLRAFIESDPPGKLRSIKVSTDVDSMAHRGYELDVEVQRNLMELGK